MAFPPVQETISYNKTRSSQRISQNSQIPSPRINIDDNPRPSKKTKKQNASQYFDIYKDIDIELDDSNTRELSILSTSPKKPRITVEIPRR